MKRIYITLSIIGSILFTACDNDSNGTANVVPTRADLIYPVQNQLCTESTINFQWNASKDANGDSITYTLRLYTDFPSLETYEDITTTSLSHTMTLEKGKAYYWEVIASDGIGELNGNINQFYTESDAVVNYAPFSAEIISPELLGDKVDSGTTVLEWTCTDLDDDPLTYNVYFGTDESSLEMVAEAISETSFEVTTEAETQYFWSVTAQDPSGTATRGHIWFFTTN